jgi:hypothetical protein
VARVARLHSNRARLQLAKERQHLTPAQRPPDNHLARAVDSVGLKSILREIETDGANIHDGWLLLLVVEDNHNFGT